MVPRVATIAAAAVGEAPPQPETPAAALGPAPTPASAPVLPTADKDAPPYSATILAHLAAFRRYPPAAKAQHKQGKTIVSFAIDARGGVSDVRLVAGGGRHDFDEEAMTLPQRAAPFPPPPAALNPPLRVELPITFALRD